MPSSKKSKNSLKRFFPSTESMSKKRGRTSLSQEKNQGENQELSSSSDTSDTEQASAKRSHVRKEPNQNWFKIYPWLKKEVEEDKIILF